MLKLWFNKQVYTPGSVVKGKLIVHADTQLNVDHVEVTATGNALLKLSEDSFIKPMSEKYLDVAFHLWKRSSSDKHGGLSAGIHEFPFEFPLPPDAPSSFKDKRGWIKYIVKAWLPSSSVFGKDYGLSIVLPVQRKVVLSTTSLNEPQYAERDVAGGLFRSSGRIKLSVEIPRSGYLVGEVIPLSGQISNTSTSSVRLVAYFIQHVVSTNPQLSHAQFHASYSRIVAPIGLFTSVSHSTERRWTCNKLCVPYDLPPTGSLEGCNFFAVSYSIKVYMFASGTAKNASITFDITVGNDMGIPQSEANGHTSEEHWYDHTIAIDRNATSTPFYLGGATGRDPLMLESFTESVAYPSSPPPTPGTTWPSLPTEGDTLVQPPSYEDLFSHPTNHPNQTVNDDQARDSPTENVTP